MKRITYLLLAFLLLNACNHQQSESENTKLLLNKIYFEKRLTDANVKWEYEDIKVSQVGTNIFVDPNILKNAKEILKNQIELTKYFKYLQSINIEERNLAFPFSSQRQYNEIEQLSLAKGYNLAKLRGYDARNKELYEEIRLQNESPQSKVVLQKIDCKIILDRNGKRTRGNYTFWLNNDLNKLLKVTNNNNKTAKAINNIIDNAINNNY